MPTKTKKTDKQIEKLSKMAQQAGIILMMAATTIGMLEAPDDAKRVVIPNRPSFAFAENNSEDNLINPIRREREENESTEANYIGYSVSQRTPSRAGRL